MTHPQKPAETDADLVPVIANRWSSVVFGDTAVSQEQTHALFEAARWAPSSYNEQPWLYVYAQKGDENRSVYEELLLDGNAWAREADILIVCFSKQTYDRNNKPNTAALHDTGASNYALVLQATHMGLATHQMGGFQADKANETLGVPEQYAPVCMIAVGNPGDPADTSDELRARDKSPRTRKPQAEFVRRGTFNA